MKRYFSAMVSNSNEFVLIASMIGILLILFSPIAPSTLDFLLLLNFSAALLILLVTFYTEKPLEFSTLPSLLLITTLFRLALNISATRLILDKADAGRVIGAVGTQVVGGNYVIGLVVFLILIVVQYVVVTNGAQRVAEVAARFILDSLPGKQMSIDADLNMGIINQDEAKTRRAQLEKESNFYGAMDGASKFVKGDAIAGIIIILIDIIAGLSIGIVQKGMNWSDALHRYTLLTVGDGIVTQIPSLVIAVATGIIITRAATDTRLAHEITRQFSAHPKIFIVVASALFILMFLPGIPAIPLLIIAFCLSLGAWIAYTKKSGDTASLPSNSETEPDFTESVDDDSIYGLTRHVPFEISLGKELASHYLKLTSEFDKRIGILRKQMAKQLGFVIPPISAKTDNSLAPNGYCVNIHGVTRGSGTIKPNALLAINPGGERASLQGEQTREPTYGLPAQWIGPEMRSQAHASGYTLVEAETVLMTHIQELCRRNAPEFLTRAETEKLIENQRERLGSLIDELIPAILSYSDVQRVLQLLIGEQIPINNLETILEVLVDSGRHEKNPEILVELVRKRISALICNQLNDKNGQIRVITLSPNLERKLLAASNGQTTSQIGLNPGELESFISKIAKETEKLLGKNVNPVLLCAAPLRRLLKNILSRAIPQIYVISTTEININSDIISAGIVDLDSVLSSN